MVDKSTMRVEMAYRQYQVIINKNYNIAYYEFEIKNTLSSKQRILKGRVYKSTDTKIILENSFVNFPELYCLLKQICDCINIK